MKRTVIFPICFLAALFLTLTVSAAEINRVTLNGDAVTVNLTAESSCALFVALYDADGRLLNVQTRNVAAMNAADVAVKIPGGIPSGSAAKASLMSADNRPVCAAVSSDASGGNTPTPTPTPTPANDSDVYAILYADGTLVFQHGDTPESGRQVRETFAVDVTKNYSNSDIPWRKARAFIYQVDFADKIQPTSTAWWFYRCSKLREVKNIKNLDTSHVTDMGGMFCGCGTLTTLDVSNFNTASVTDMRSMFADCGALTTLDVSGFDTANVTDMGSMFDDCGALRALDVSGFDTANVTNMGFMFSECGALTTLDVSKFNTTKTTYMFAMFRGCRALTTLDVSGFNTSNVTNMGDMFRYCGALTVLDLSRFNTANVTDMSVMFQLCYGLTTIYASSQFITSQVTESSSMFSDCDFLIGGNGTTYDREHRDIEYARIDGGPSAPGYFTAK